MRKKSRFVCDINCVCITFIIQCCFSLPKKCLRIHTFFLFFVFTAIIIIVIGLLLFRGAFKLLLLFFTIYLRFLSLSHFRIFVSIIFFLLSLIGNFLFLPSLPLLLFWISPHIESVRCLHTSMCTHFVCVCVYAIHLYYYLRIFTCAFLLLPLFSMTASIHGIGNFRELQNFAFGFSDFFFLSFCNCTEIVLSSEIEKKIMSINDTTINNKTPEQTVNDEFFFKAKQNFLFGKIVVNFLMHILNQKQSKEN